MYKYSLESILKQRKFIEDKLQKKMAVLNKELGDEEIRLNMENKVREQCLEELKQKQERNISMSELLLYTKFIRKITVAINKQEVIVLRAKKKVDQNRENMVDAMKNRKIIEKLKEKDWKNYSRMSSKRDQEFLNEVGISRFSQIIQ